MEQQITKLKNRKELEKVLADELTSLNNDDEYNIFIHEVNSVGEYEDVKIKGILKCGLDLSKYATILGTTLHTGSSKGLDPNKIIDSKYHVGCALPKIIIAIPKYVTVDGKKYEYSSLDENGKNELSALFDEYKQKYGPVERHHKKVCLFDAVKGTKDLPTYYTLCAIIPNDDDNSYTYIQPNTHITKQSNEEIAKIKAGTSKHISNFFKTVNSTDIPTCIFKKFNEEYQYLINKALEDID